jgi:hypothetical protein
MCSLFLRDKRLQVTTWTTRIPKYPKLILGWYLPSLEGDRTDPLGSYGSVALVSYRR